VAYAVLTLQSGVREAVDTATYSHWADLLISVRFNLAEYLRAQDFVAPPLTYLLWVVVVAALKSALGGSWMIGVVTLNLIALTFGAYLTIEAVRKATSSSASMLLAAALFLVGAELLIFVPYVLSDLMFWGLSTAVLACGVTTAILPGHNRAGFARNLIAGTVLLLAALLFRPVVLPLLLFWVAAIAAWFARPLLNRFAPAMLIATTLALFVGIIAQAYLLARPELWPFGTLPAILTMVGNEARQGMFVHNASPPLLVEPAIDVIGFARITLQKWLFFITPWLPVYSAAHTIINLLFFVPAYGLSIAAMRNLSRLAPSQRRAACLLAFFILVLSAFHALMLIDSDHRYRLPMLPALIMLGAIGLESVRRPRMLASTDRAK
jgi:hypothetical protein